MSQKTAGMSFIRIFKPWVRFKMG